MANLRRAGVSEAGEGERLERERRNRKTWIIGGLVIFGGITGFFIGARNGAALFGGSGGWPPAMAIAVAASYVIAAVGGGLILARHTDEVELLGQYKAIAAAALVYVLVYPVWFVLWMGDLVREPMHAIIFALFWISLTAASLFYRFR